MKRLTFLRLFVACFSGLLMGLASLPLVFNFLFPKDAKVVPSGADKLVKVMNHKIRYRDSGGTGVPLIMLHSFGGNLGVWSHLAEELSDFRILRLDLIGFGGSDRPVIDYGLETQREYLLGFMDALKINRAVLVGSSMGGSISAWTAAKNRNRIGALVLFAPSGYPGSMWHRWPNRLFYRPGTLSRFGQLITRNRLFQRLFPHSLAYQAFGITSSYKDSYIRALSEISQPTLIFWSVEDRRVPFSFSEKYTETIDNSTLIIRSRDAGHTPQLYDPPDTAAKIRVFIEDHIEVINKNERSPYAGSYRSESATNN